MVLVNSNSSTLCRVIPLVKVVDQIQCEAITSDNLLHFLLHEALTGNSRTVLIYCIHPQGEWSSGHSSTILTRILFSITLTLFIHQVVWTTRPPLL